MLRPHSEAFGALPNVEGVLVLMYSVVVHKLNINVRTTK